MRGHFRARLFQRWNDRAFFFGFLPMANLTPKQERFCQAYIKTGNATEAYRAAYDCGRMKPETVNRAAKQLLDNSKITTRIKELQAQYIRQNDLSPDKVLKEWAAIGFSDIRQLLNENGGLLPVSQWPDSVSAAVAAVKIRQEPTQGDDPPADIIELKLWPKTNALDALSKNLGLFKEDNDQRRPNLEALNPLLQAMIDFAKSRK